MNEILGRLSNLKDEIFWANLYGRIYGKSTGFKTVEECLEILYKLEPLYDDLAKEFKVTYPDADVDVEIEFFRFKNSGLCKGLDEIRSELGLYTLDSIIYFRKLVTIKAIK